MQSPERYIITRHVGCTNIFSAVQVGIPGIQVGIQAYTNIFLAVQVGNRFMMCFGKVIGAPVRNKEFNF